jgi:hypothetical protein
MNGVSFDVACEARFAMERACAPMAAERRSADHLATMRAEIHRQSQPGLTDEAFCASDVAFHRALVDAAGNPVLSYQLAGAVEAMQPLMNMITFTARSREAIVALHARIADAAEARDAARVSAALEELEAYTVTLARSVLAARAAHRNTAAKVEGSACVRPKRLRAGNIECTCSDWGRNLVYAASDQMPPTGIPTNMTRHFVLGTAISAVLAIPAFAQDLLVFDYSGFEDPSFHAALHRHPWRQPRVRLLRR